MSQTTILVIDDSATIRRLVDQTLSAAGYRVVLAPNAEDGIAQARAIYPDLILLDHQLPGTTGFEVCRQLLEIDELRHTPVVVSSTLRKKAYAEYTDSSNVVDQLPKPYTEELLTTTVSNALATGRLIVQSQTDGTAVPEVVNAVEDADVSGSFANFSLREVLDFLNNGNKCGMLEVEVGQLRVTIALNDGRIQAVVANGVDPVDIMQTLPDSLSDLAPVLKLTVAGRMCSEIDGLVELLDRKVLDPRLLRAILRHQAAMLIWRCFHGKLSSFHFVSGRLPAPLFRNLPLDVSLSALLVEAALRCDAGELAEETPETFYSRRAIRGQNLDRSGLSAQHMQILGGVGDAVTAKELAARLGTDPEETRRILQAVALADLVTRQTSGRSRSIVVLDDNATSARELRRVLDEAGQPYSAKIVRDQLAVQLLLKRSQPDALIVPLDTDSEREFAASLQKHLAGRNSATRWIGLRDSSEQPTDTRPAFPCDALVERPYNAEQLLETLDRVFNGSGATPDSVTSDSPALELSSV